MQELSFRKDMMRAILRPDEERERNVVPVKEALSIPQRGEISQNPKTPVPLRSLAISTIS